MTKIKLPDFSKSHILVIGDVMLDRYWHGSTSRISPEAPVPVVKVNDIEERAGGAGNVALNIASLGGQAKLVAVVGDDEPAQALKTGLIAQGVCCEFLTQANAPTITKLRVMSRHQQLIRLDFEDGFANVDAGHIEQSFVNALEATQAVILSDYGKGTLRNIPALIALANQQNKQVFIDPKGTDFDRYQNATLITPNQSEFEAVVGACPNDEVLIEKGEALRARLNLDALLVTRSEKGMALFERGQAPFMQATQAKDVFDVTGAGDTVIATLATSVCSGQSFKEAVQVANLAAGIVVGKVGTATTHVSELNTALALQNNFSTALLDEASAINCIQHAQCAGEKVVMTNGCFDILHPGHVAYLKEAARLGDKLIVAVNSDDSVKRLKGEERPINPLSHRMTMLSALESVDWVVPFEEDTPERLITACLPDVLVKGGDYQIHEIAGGQAVMDNGGEVKVLKFLEGHSTSGIIDKISRTK